ncbi:amino acid adenylation domain-containing protein [Bacillus thuringiensis]|uniref:amino acid adenylation domain-containing protein n=1 Tax=Bacillus tropicus TaxID=2026188 RepID=UPI0035D72A18
MKENRFPLTHPQKRILYNETIYPNTPIHNIGGTVTIKGLIDVGILRKAIQECIKRHPSLNMVLKREGEEVYQCLENSGEDPEVGFLDFSQYNAGIEFEKWVKKEAETPFSIFGGTLYSFMIFKKNKEYGYFIKLHHIIADGWSVQILTEQITKLYDELIGGQKSSDVGVSPSYHEFALREQKYLQSNRFKKDKEFWNDKLKDFMETFLLQSSSDLKGGRREFEIDQTLSSSIRSFLSKHRISMNAFFVSVLSIYLYKIYQQKDLIIGTPVLNRSGKKEKSILGMFTSTMPFRTKLNEDDSFINYVNYVNSDLMKSFFYQRYPYDLLVNDLELRKKGYNDLFRICVNYYNTKHPTKFDGHKVENDEFYNGFQFYSLQMVIKEWEQEETIDLIFDYKIHDYSEHQIEAMYKAIRNIIRFVISNEYEKVINIPLLSKEGYEKLIYDYNNTTIDYPGNKTIYELFEEQVSRTPQKIAVQFEGKSLTYEELNKMANQAARFLKKIGLTKGSLVGVMMTPSLEMVAMLLGILKSGTAYLPIDTNYPLERISYMLDNSGISLLVSNVRDKKIDFSGKVIYLDNEDIFTGEDSNLCEKSSPDDIAYVIYTSGSTGKSKGTIVHHQGLVNYVWWANSAYTQNENEVFPLYSSLSFDLTVTSLFVPLIAGNQIVIYQEDKLEFVLFKILRDNLATIIKLTPAHLALLKNEDNRQSSIRRIIVGGEDLKVNLARSIYESFGGKVEIFNEYGPTEAVVGCMIHKYDYNQDTNVSVPIGKPANNVKLYVLDHHLQPLPINSIGELYISGDCVTKGYLNNSALTNERFITNPFLADSKMYKTGDLVRWVEDGNMEYIGRIDTQIKLRGYRIELGEIEHHLLQMEEIENAIVTLFENNEQKALCAYIKANESIPEREFKEHLVRNLPEYMVPSYFIQLEEIPLDSNGKINRKELPLPRVNSQAGEDKYEQTEPQKILIKALEEVLQRRSIQVIDNFFHLGGDSIKAIQVVSKLNHAGYSIQVKNILSNPEIKNMVLFLEESHTSHTEEVCEGFIKHLPITRWFFSQHFSNENHFNQSVLLKLKKTLSLDDLNRVFSYIVKHHDSLRINYNRKRDELFYHNELMEIPFNVQFYDLRTENKVEQWKQIEEIGTKLKSSFDITKELLLKVALFILDEKNQYLLITAHHLVIDGVSWRILLEDVNSLLNQIEQERPLTLAPKTVSYQKWSKVYHEWGEAIDSVEQKYWEAIKRVNFELPVDNQNIEQNLDKRGFKLSKEDTQLLISKANHAYNTGTNTLLLVSLGLAIHEFFGKEDIVIELEGHGREEIVEQLDLSRTIGWFTTMYPILLNCRKEESLTERIKKWKRIFHAIPSNGSGYGYLNYLKGETTSLKKAQVRFNFLGDFDSSLSSEYFKWSDLSNGEDISSGNHLSAVLEIIALIIDGVLHILVIFNNRQHNVSTIVKFNEMFSHKLKEVISHCVNREELYYTPSDFETTDLSNQDLENLFL